MNKLFEGLKKYLISDLSDADYTVTLILVLLAENLFLGALIPLQVISTGMTQFIIGSHNPLNIVTVTTFVYICIAAILFLIYKFVCKGKAKKIFISVFTGILIWTIINYFVFGARFDVITPILVYDGNIPQYTSLDYIWTLWILLGSIVLAFILSKLKNLRKDLLFVLLMAITIFSFMRWHEINKKVTPYVKSLEKAKYIDVKDVKPIYNFSTNKQNVVVVMLDRYVGKYFERVIANYPELKKQFDGFTFYPNTISFGFQTTTGSPGLFGGYDYIPVESDKRDKENIVDKHNEALTTMPILFGENDYDVVISNYPDVNYWNPAKPNPFKGLKNVRVASYKGKVYDETLEEGQENSVKSQTIHFVQYPFMMFVPIMFRDFIYNDGKYLLSGDFYALNYSFLISKLDLKIMNNKTSASKTDKNQFISFNNTSTHEPHYLSYPDFEVTYNPKEFADSTKISMFAENEVVPVATYSDIDGNEIGIDWKEHLTNYGYYDTCVMVAREMGKWLDYLRELKVYDNSRIIITSDHGVPYNKVMRTMDVSDDPSAKYRYRYKKNIGFSTLQYNPIMMVKDFNETGFKVSDEFMTNADTVYLATKDLIDNPRNPHTNNIISNDYKDRNKFYVASEMSPWEPTYHWDDTRHETENRIFLSLEGHDMWDVFKWDCISGFRSPECDVHRNVVKREAYHGDIKDHRCGLVYLKDFYECMDCGNMYYDAEMTKPIENKADVLDVAYHKFVNYVRNFDEDEVKHGTMTAECIYGCGTKSTKGDPDALYHHEENTTLVHKNATFTEDGYNRNECSICWKSLDTDWEVIPRLDSAEIEYYSTEYDGKQKTPEVIITDRTGKIVDAENYKVRYENNRNAGIADADISFKDPYEGNRKEYFAITPSKIDIVNVTYEKNRMEIEMQEVQKRPDGYEIEGSSSKNFANAVKFDGRIRKKQFIVVDNVDSSLKYFRVRSYDEVYANVDETNGDIKNNIKEIVNNGRIYADWVEFER